MFSPSGMVIAKILLPLCTLGWRGRCTIVLSFIAMKGRSLRRGDPSTKQARHYSDLFDKRLAARSSVLSFILVQFHGPLKTMTDTTKSGVLSRIMRVQSVSEVTFLRETSDWFELQDSFRFGEDLVSLRRDYHLTPDRSQQMEFLFLKVHERAKTAYTEKY